MRKKQFTHRAALELELTNAIVAELSRGIAQRGRASILFSGGSTPKGLLGRLSAVDFNWEAVHVGLVDDRMVPPDSAHSNANMIRTLFLDACVSTAPRFHPLVTAHENAESNMKQAMQSVTAIGTPDVVVLGMGGDGHFASLFPGDPASDNGLDATAPAKLIYTQAPAAPRNRISHSWSYLRTARNLFLHLTGQEKRQLIEAQASRQSALPIDTVLSDEGVDPMLYWAP